MWVNHQELEGLYKELNELRQELNRLKESTEPNIKLNSRVDTIELWQGKVHSLIIEKNKKGEDKLTKIGRNLAGISLNSL